MLTQRTHRPAYTFTAGSSARDRETGAGEAHFHFDVVFAPASPAFSRFPQPCLTEDRFARVLLVRSANVALPPQHAFIYASSCFSLFLSLACSSHGVKKNSESVSFLLPHSVVPFSLSFIYFFFPPRLGNCTMSHLRYTLFSTAPSMNLNRAACFSLSYIAPPSSLPPHSFHATARACLPACPRAQRLPARGAAAAIARLSLQSSIRSAACLRCSR